MATMLSALVSEPVVAGEADTGGILTFQFANDFVADSDGQFSHGTRVSWMSPEDHVPAWTKRLADMVPRFNVARSKRIVYSLSQSIFTPDDISVKQLIADDRPYAGWLHGKVGLVSVGDHVIDNLELSLGVVGPASFAEETQKTWHRWFGFERPQGWDNQLENEPAVQLFFERKWRAWRTFGVGALGGDVVPHIGVGLGNVFTQGTVGLTLRIGKDVPNDYGPPRIRPSQPGSDYFVSGGGFDWYLFVGAEGRAVAHNIFLDGNTFEDSHSVDKKHFVADFQAGAAVFVGDVRIAYTHILRTKEFDTQDRPEQFGAFSISFGF